MSSDEVEGWKQKAATQLKNLRKWITGAVDSPSKETFSHVVDGLNGYLSMIEPEIGVSTTITKNVLDLNNSKLGELDQWICISSILKELQNLILDAEQIEEIIIVQDCVISRISRLESRVNKLEA